MPVMDLMTSSSISIPHSAVPKTPKVIADRNVQNVVLGDVLFKTWYPSFYPEELVGKDIERLYICQWCFKYSKELMPFLAHAVCHECFVSAGSCLPCLLEGMRSARTVATRKVNIRQRLVLNL